MIVKFYPHVIIHFNISEDVANIAIIRIVLLVISEQLTTIIIEKCILVNTFIYYFENLACWLANSEVKICKGVPPNLSHSEQYNTVNLGSLLRTLYHHALVIFVKLLLLLSNIYVYV